MKIASGSPTIRVLLCLLLALLLGASAAWAKPTTPEQARGVVLNWLGLEAAPMGAPLGGQIRQVQTFNDRDGNPAYYVVYLNPAGMVFVPADDLVEPIIGFLPEGRYDPSPANPLGALVSQDIPARLLQAREVEAQALATKAPLAPESPQAVAQRKWAWLGGAAPGQKAGSGIPNAPALESGSGIPSVSDLRVAPLIQTVWSQTTVDDTTTGLACYNYYTFPFAPGSSDNYPCGCVATAMAQLMRFWQYPTTGVGTGSYTVYVDTAPMQFNLRGSDGYGAPYAWGNMPLTYNSSSTLAQRQAIGNLTRDAGLSVGMSYMAAGSGASSVGTGALINTFGYSNAKRGLGPLYPWNLSPGNIPTANRNAMVNPNLDAGYPVLLGLGVYTYSPIDPTIFSMANGHAVVCDGYGYNTQSMYHHLNMGWSGLDDAWYNLPLVYTTSYNFNGIGEVGYNIFTSGSGEIIAGRVTDNAGHPVSGATVTATGGYTATTNANGIYALVKVLSGTTFTISVAKAGLMFTPQTVSTATSVDDTINTGNLWGVDFVSANSIFNQALDNYSLNFSTSGDANWFSETSTWYYGGSAAQSGAIANGQSTSLQTTVVGPGTLSFYRKVSSYQYYNKFNLYLDTALIDGISGGVDWTQKTLSIPAGQHTVTWQYSKTTSQTSPIFSDCAWLDKVVYTSSGNSKALGGVFELLLMN